MRTSTIAAAKSDWQGGEEEQEEQEEADVYYLQLASRWDDWDGRQGSRSQRQRAGEAVATSRADSRVLPLFKSLVKMTGPAGPGGLAGATTSASQSASQPSQSVQETGPALHFPLSPGGCHRALRGATGGLKNSRLGKL